MFIKERHIAKLLRAKGYSLKEIAAKLKVAKSSVSHWVQEVPLSYKAEQRLLTRIKRGQFVAARNKRERTKKIEKEYLERAMNDLSQIDVVGDYAKLLCAVIYWCEGNKNAKWGMNFINSDPHLMKMFLALFRNSFSPKEEKFKLQLHLHSYHDVLGEIDFWSKMVNIENSQFVKPYIKPNTGKRIRDNYHGCLSLRYYDADIARKLLAYGKAFLNKT
ncbi:MAG: hypothetical protein AAB518_01990 [Patescibacteria group bacterium]